MFQRKFEKFNSGQETAIEAACVIVEQMASRTLMPNKPLAIWFGAADRVALTSKLRKMSAVIADSNRTVTFVNRTGGSLGVAHTSIYEKKLLPPDKKENLDGVVAYAHPVDRRDEPGPKKTVSHVGSGMRIYLNDVFFTLEERLRAATIYHEMTHKVLATNDHAYDDADCQNLATSDPAKAIDNADNFALYAAAC